MPNMTISIPEELHKRMKSHPEIRWSEIVRKAIAEYLEKLRPEETVEAHDLLDVIRETGINIDSIPLEKAAEHYEKMRESEWKRPSMTQAS